MKNTSILALMGIVLVVSTTIFLFTNKKPKLELLNNTQNSSTENMITPTQTIKNETGVPLPQETDIVRTFFQLIGEGRVSEAVMMMNPQTTDNESMKQAWGVQLNAFKTVEIKSIEASMPETWTENEHVYKVMANVKMKPEAANEPIPNYGWENGSNVKWIEIEKINGKWFINGIASGP